MNIDFIDELQNSGVKPTPVRILVFKTLKNAPNPLSLTEIENALLTVDKSTISRTLTTFKSHDLVHSFNDGSGSLKYELCHDSHKDPNHHNDLHVHFRCQKCGNTFCLTSIKVPKVEIPEGYIVDEVCYLLSGICSSCSNH